MREQAPPDVGTRLKVLRQERGLSLRALAAICDLSPNTISLIERGVTSPSVSTLHRLATALRLPITIFFEEGPDRMELVLQRAGKHPRSGNASVLLENLGAGLENQALSPFLVTLKPGATSGRRAMVHVGHELVYCFQGEIEYTVEDQVFTLATGDSLLFEARLPHRWRNPGGEPAVFLLVFQAPVLDDTVEQHLLP